MSKLKLQKGSRPGVIGTAGAAFRSDDLVSGNEINAGYSATDSMFPSSSESLGVLAGDPLPPRAPSGVNGISTALQSSIYNLVIANEVSSNAGTANKLTQVGQDWSFGWIQDDFATTNRPNADLLLTKALTAASYSSPIIPTIVAAFDSSSGTNSAANINVMLQGLVGPDGKPVTVNSINSTFQTSVSASATIDSISQSQLDNRSFSLSNGNSLYYRLENAGTVGNTGTLNSAVAADLSDPRTQAYILDPLTDYNNQFGVDTNGPMWGLLTKGSATFGGTEGTLYAPTVTITLDSSSPTSVEQSILKAEFNTTYGYNNPQDVCRREAEDINNQNQYLSANGENPLTGTISVSNGAPGTITNTCSINSIISNGTSDTNWAVTNSTGQITSSGTAADNGASSTYAE